MSLCLQGPLLQYCPFLANQTSVSSLAFQVINVSGVRMQQISQFSLLRLATSRLLRLCACKVYFCSFVFELSTKHKASLASNINVSGGRMKRAADVTILIILRLAGFFTSDKGDSH